MKNITFSADERLIALARNRALHENSTLNAKFREWLEKYVAKKEQLRDFDNLINRLSNVKVEGEIMTREQRNER